MKANKIRLSILDQSPVKFGGTSKEAIYETIALAQRADQLGYTRFWVTEYHNRLAYASSAPEILIAELAAKTKNIRIGSGGVMLPNHSALKVAENFRMLELLYPGRIDLGLGRASGTDPKTEEILNPSGKRSDEDFAAQLAELSKFLGDRPKPGETKQETYAVPRIDSAPPLWLLTSGGQSAVTAAKLGTGLAFAHFIRPVGGPETAKLYRETFQPSAELAHPEVSVGAFVFCSEDQEVLSRYQAVMDYRFLQLSKFGRLPSESYENIKDLKYSEEDQEKITFNRQRMISGTPDQIKPKIEQFLESYQSAELLACALTDSFEERIRSFELLADLFLKSN
jgi:luciferase family oxidoreductase group 1